MRQLGDITRISGYTAPVVDAVIGGSPCQGLSQAGKRRGLADERSGRFMEQIRVIKEMREADARTGRTGRFIRPRFMVFENVPGAFSSNKREDFRRVLEETIRIAAPDAPDIPLPRKWPMADAWYGDGWSVAYRVLDAQFWGVPQRRRRIALVADFGGHAAPEILFVRKSVCGDTAPSGAAGEETAGGTGDSAETAGGCRCAGLKHKAGAKAGSIGFAPEIAPTLSAEQQSAVYDARGNGDGETVCTLAGDHANRVTDYTAIVMAPGQAGTEIMRDVLPTLNCDHEQPIVAHALCGSGKDPHREDAVTYPVTHGRVRRLTPLECERLQGYPDGWTDIGPWVDSKGKLHKESSDSARYKALGNSIALPPWAWVLKRLCACYERPATMACLGAIELMGWPLDRIVHAEVWATDTIPADLPPMVEFKRRADEIIKRRWGITVEHYSATNVDGVKGERVTYQDAFYHVLQKGKNKGAIKGFPMQRGQWCQKLKLSAIYAAENNTRNAIQYIGIAADEPERIAKHKDKPNVKMPLVAAGWTEAMCREWCEQNDLLSPIYTTATRGGCWFCHNQGVDQLRLLRRNYPEYWALMLKWDKDSPVTFKSDGRTVHDYERRFAAEDTKLIMPDEYFCWAKLDNPLLNYRLF